MHKLPKMGLLILLFAILVAIRAYAPSLFYDPLISFFKTNHSTSGLPTFNMGRLIVFTSLRFWANTIISLMILWVLFRKQTLVRFSLLLYILFFIGLIVCFIILLKVSKPGEHMLLFYVRRFLIHPLLLLLLIPAFYFQKGRK
ncbi:MAG: exosortase F system-associated protein [Alteromonas sp.]|nr:exosortase F system-associated protein [Alteromonas sp.]MAY21745.1 exosortase F system-associated protein [Flavobacteriaceae bacterium]